MALVEESEENMYKCHLQELCHKKKWALPIYSAMKDGLEHNPQFKASVLVNGTYFNTINICKSLKEAYNEAAKLAFLHFSSETTVEGTNVDEQQIMKIGDEDSKMQKINEDENELPCGGKLFVKTSCFGDDTKQKFKPKLQMYAQRKNIDMPMYHSSREGPPNSLCFRTTVTVGGDSFKSPFTYNSIKQAEDAAAQVALMAFSTEAFQQNDIRLYKNLLQEYALSEGFFMPQYKTTITGEAHDPTFHATVEIEGENFHGNPAMSKKQAELNAAKVAYTNLMQRKSGQTGDFSSGSSRNEVLKLASCFKFLNHNEVKVNHISKSQTSSTLFAKYGVPTELNKAKTGFEMKAISLPADTGISGKSFKMDDLLSSSSEDSLIKLTPHTSSSNEKEAAVLDRSILEKSRIKINENAPVPSWKDTSTMKMTTDTKCYLLNNRIRVYTYIPDVDSTMGNVVLAIGEGKWVIVNLEFPN